MQRNIGEVEQLYTCIITLLVFVLIISLVFLTRNPLYRAFFEITLVLFGIVSASTISNSNVIEAVIKRK